MQKFLRVQSNREAGPGVCVSGVAVSAKASFDRGFNIGQSLTRKLDTHKPGAVRVVLGTYILPRYFAIGARQGNVSKAQWTHSFSVLFCVTSTNFVI